MMFYRLLRIHNIMGMGKKSRLRGVAGKNGRPWFAHSAESLGMEAGMEKELR